MIHHETGTYKHSLSRTSYTRLVWKPNHHVFGRPTPGCWNTVHCGPRDGTHAQQLRNTILRGSLTTGLTEAEFLAFFEKTDSLNISLYLDNQKLRFFHGGKWHEITKSPANTKTLRDYLNKQGWLSGSAKVATPVKTTTATSTKEVINNQAAFKKWMKQYSTMLQGCSKEQAQSIFEGKLPMKAYGLIRLGVSEKELDKYFAWATAQGRAISSVKLKVRIRMFNARNNQPVEVAAPVAVDIMALAQMFAPLPEFQLLGVLPVPQPPRQPEPTPEVNELETVEPFYNKIYEAEPAKAIPEPVIDAAEPEQAVPEPENVISEPVKAVADADKTEIVLIKRQCKPQTGTLTLRKKRVRKLIDREEKADVMFYGKRRRTQAQFRDAVALNCFDRCVISGASLIRCEAAHLLAHARKGGASFKNGLLLRADLHTLFDAGECAIDPQVMTIHFSLTILESDPDLAAYEGKAICTLKPINRANLDERWTAFLTVYMETDTAA